MCTQQILEILNKLEFAFLELVFQETQVDYGMVILKRFQFLLTRCMDISFVACPTSIGRGSQDNQNQ